MSVLKYFGFQSEKQVVETLASIQPERVPSRLRGRLAKVKQKQGGFTLLELLVVVAIIAAIAGTSTILLRDTDRQAAAAAHVAMMDELIKGISTYAKLNDNKFPDRYDSLQAVAGDPGATVPAGTLAAVINADLAASLATATLDADQVDLLAEAGIEKLRFIDSTVTDANWSAGDCTSANIQALINHKGNNVTASTIFSSATHKDGANNVRIGCGGTNDRTLAASDVVVTWASTEAARVNAPTLSADQTLVALGIGPDTTLFNPENRGAMTTVPTYRHVAADEYNRFIAIFNVDKAVGEVRLQAIVDGAGDTKDEELGEWDNTRPT